MPSYIVRFYDPIGGRVKKIAAEAIDAHHAEVCVLAAYPQLANLDFDISRKRSKHEAQQAWRATCRRESRKL